MRFAGKHTALKQVDVLFASVLAGEPLVLVPKVVSDHRLRKKKNKYIEKYEQGTELFG